MIVLGANGGRTTMFPKVALETFGHRVFEL